MRLAIIVINYRTPDLVEGCLASLEGQVDPERDAVVVVDNASGDGSDERIREMIVEKKWEKWVRLVCSPVNGGFAAGNNVGIRTVDASYYLLINSDTVARPGAIGCMIEALESKPGLGLIGPRLEWPDGTPQESCFNFRTPITELLTGARTSVLTRMFPGHMGTLPVSDDPIEPDWISFACVVIKRAVIEQVGLLDEGYFMYYDDIDYCRHARQAGWGVLYWPKAHVVHLRGGSGPVKELTKKLKRRPAYFYASRARYFAKYYSRTGLWLTNILWEFGRAVALLRETFGKKERHTCDREAIDIWANWLDPMRLPGGGGGGGGGGTGGDGQA